MNHKSKYSLIQKKVLKLFPLNQDNKLSRFVSTVQKVISLKTRYKTQPRIGGNYGKEIYQSLIDKYSNLPYYPASNVEEKLSEIASDLFSGVPRWRSPKLLYNVGAATNAAASAMYAVTLDENIYNINEGLAGNALVAEHAVTNILAKLAKLETKPYGVFTFGGTATNMYAIKVGTRKALPNSGKTGLQGKIKVLLTEDAHFSHAVSVDWLGIGTENVEVIKSNFDRTSNLEDAERKIRKIIESGHKIAAIIINGGTTYGHTIDDTELFVNLRDKLVKEYHLDYKPHVHVDTVIGWAWLMFSDYDFDGNPLDIKLPVLRMIKKQYQKIMKVQMADSWGIDFHKGVGACPIDCSLVIMNDYASTALLSKKEDKNLNMHQLAQEFSFFSPVDYTLETSRAGGPSLAALTSLLTLGKSGYQVCLSNLIESTWVLKKEIARYKDFEITNRDSLGYVVMVRLYPPNLIDDQRKGKELYAGDSQMGKFINIINKYNKEFFGWDLETRIKKNRGVEYSYSSNFANSPSGVEISAIKLYPVSPHFNAGYAKETIKTIKEQKSFFDSNIWNKM